MAIIVVFGISFTVYMLFRFAEYRRLIRVGAKAGMQ
jgi:hypothetical protein